MNAHVLLGFEVGTGARVEVPIAHTFVTGQTQLSGKTTTLRAVVERSQRRALAFVTKRGESFPGRRIPPYLPREGEQPIHWRLVETILASALGQRNMKWERIWLVNAVKRPAVATSLATVRSNVAALLGKAKGDRSVEAYTLIGEYLDLVLPDMRKLAAADVLELQPGLNVMDLAGVSQQLQALVIRASLEHINQHERDVLTVFPEAWEFAPRQTNTPAKDAAIAMARKGAVLGNFLLCDSQDIAGVDTVVRQAASVWILGVQRELNELKRTIQTIPAGITRPKPEQVAQLEVGEFFACWGRHAVKTYVLPPGVSEIEGRAVALGQKPRPRLAAPVTSAVTTVRAPNVAATDPLMEFAARGLRAQQAVDQAIDEHRNDAREQQTVARTKGGEDAMNPQQERKLDALVDAVKGQAPALSAIVGKLALLIDRVSLPGPATTTPAKDGPVPRREYAAEETMDNESLYQSFKSRLIAELESDPRVMDIVVSRPELRVKVQRHVVEVDGDTLEGRLALLIHEGFFDQAKTSGNAFAEVTTRGFKTAHPNVSRELDNLARKGFVRRSNKWYTAVPDMKRSIVEADA